MERNFFLDMIQHLRENEEVIFHENILTIAEKEKVKVVNFLRNEYEKEALTFPFEIPEYDKEAAIWAAESVYIAAQLILYRKDEDTVLVELFKEPIFEINAAAILSADLCLRFIPSMLFEIKNIDTEDPLIEILEEILLNWHYSGINYKLVPEDLNFDAVNKSRCLMQLYCNRIIEFKNLRLARIPNLYDLLKANLGIYTNEYWADFNTITIDE